MTEIAGASHATPSEGKIKYGSVGLLLPNLECKVCYKFYSFTLLLVAVLQVAVVA